MRYFIDAITKHYFDFKGRARRAEYWYFVLFYLIFAVLLAIVEIGISEIFGKDINILTKGYGIALTLPCWGIAVRRMHDIGKSAWWAVLLCFGSIFIGLFIALFVFSHAPAGMFKGNPWLVSMMIMFVPLIGYGWFIVLAARDSQPGENKWGRNPKEPELKAQVEEREVAKKFGLD